VTAAEKAVTSADGATGVADKDAKTVTIKAPDAATAQTAADALVAAGFFGVSEDASVKIVDASGVKDATVKSLTINGAHLCCDKCSKGVTAALEGVKGVTGNTAEKGAKSFDVKGEFNAKEVVTALEKAGYTGKVAN
jgi:copper chaperone CopZ